MNTAKSATGTKEQIIFASRQHKDFYYMALDKVGNCDADRQAFLYCLGINQDTRKHVCSIYDFDNQVVKPDCLCEAYMIAGRFEKVTLQDISEHFEMSRNVSAYRLE